MKLNDEQRAFAENNIKLVWKYIYTHNLSPSKDEDLIGDLFEEYCKIICKFDKSKSEFSTFLYFSLDNKVRKVYNYNQRKGRHKAKYTLSLDSWDDEEDNYSVELGREDSALGNIEWKDICERIEHKLGKCERKGSHYKKIELNEMFNMLCNGYTRLDISRQYGMSEQAISARIKRKIRPVWEKELEGC